MLKKISITCDRIALIALALLFFCLPFSKAAIESFFGISCFFWLLKKIFKSEYKIIFSELNRPLLFFMIINSISLILSTDLTLSARGFIGKILEYIFIYIIVAETINSKRRLKIIGVVVLLSVVMMLADGATQYFLGKDFLRGYPLGDMDKLRASFATRNDFGVWLAVILVFASSFVLFGKIKLRPLKIAMVTLIALLLISLFLTYSRGAWLSFIIGVLFIIIFLAKRKKPYLVMVFTAIIAISVYMIKSDPMSSAQRINLWKEALMIIQDFPLFGAGLNTYTAVAPKYVLSAQTGIYAHNSYLQMAAETGLIGLFNFFWILVVLFQSKIKYLNTHKDPILIGILSGIIVLLAHNFVDVDLYSLQLAVLFWSLLGLSVSVTNLN